MNSCELPARLFKDGDVRNVVTLRNNDHSFIFLYDDDTESAAAACRVFGSHAADRELPFDWTDAVRCAKIVRCDVRNRNG